MTPTPLPPRQVISLFALGILLFAGCPASQPRVVLYCAQDREFAEESLGEFSKKTNLTVDKKFDTEADKSVSLYNELIADSDRPRCDVFWNNEILSTIRLQKKGLLEPYDSPSAKPYPSFCKASDQTWHAFASRARVLIVNTKLVAEGERPKSLFDLTDERWKGKIVMAKPQFGTTATQAACLFEVLGADRAKKFYLDLAANGVQLAPGNKQVAEWVGQGRTPTGQTVVVGMTDTDDALGEKEKNPNVAIIFPDRDAPKEGRMGTLFLPNTVCMLKDSPNPDGARKLIDYLLSAEVETRLAETASHQIPLNPNVKAKLPAGMETPATVKAMEVDFEKAAALWDEVQDFLRKEFAKP
jgi:iron(III) transport system substrate-binding protein